MPYSNIDKPSKYFNTVLWTGDGTSSKPITGVGFKPDFVWMKARSSAGTNHHVFDSVRIVSSTPQRLFPNLTNAEDGNFGTLNSFDTDGFTLGNNVSGNQSGVTFVGWNWLASNTSGSSNTSGTITSTVAVNTTAGFSIVSYTGTGSNATVGHGLGVTPKMVIIKGRDTAYDWVVWFSDFSTTQRLLLNTTDAISTGGWNTLPTSSVFGLGTHLNINQSTKTYIAYCFAEIKGFSKFGSYKGNGSTDGTFVYTGFKPAFVIFKLTSGVDSWVIKDNKRDSINQMSKRIFPDLQNAEDTGSGGEMDFLSNGFKFRSGSTALNNASGSSYIYMAFAENPFVSSKGIPCTAR